MDLFSQMLPTQDEPGYKGRFASVCSKASRWYGLYFTYRDAEAVLNLYDKLMIEQYKETNQPVNRPDAVRLLYQAIRKIGGVKI